MTADLALIISLVSIASAIWLFVYSKNKRHASKKVCDKTRKLRSLEKAVKSLAEEMKDV